jgi:hypothetical protein
LGDENMYEKKTAFRFPLTRILPLLGSFLFLLMIIIGSIFVGGYHPVVTVILWLAFIGSGWVGLSDLLALIIVSEEGLQIRSLSLRGVRTTLIPWADVQELNLSGHQRDVLKLLARQGVSVSRWNLPAHLDLAQAVVDRADLEPGPDNQPPGVSQAFEMFRGTRARSQRYFLYWQWRRVERESEDE